MRINLKDPNDRILKILFILNNKIAKVTRYFLQCYKDDNRNNDNNMNDKNNINNDSSINSNNNINNGSNKNNDIIISDVYKFIDP